MGKRELLQDFTVKIGKGEKAFNITVPAGFKTDYSSIPRGFRWTMLWTKVDIAGVVHDWLYARAKYISMTKLQTDRVWRDVARSGYPNANPLQAAAGWLGLAIGGLLVWRCYKRNPPTHLYPEGFDD